MRFGAQPVSSLSLISCLRQSCCSSPCRRKTVSTPPPFYLLQCLSIKQQGRGSLVGDFIFEWVPRERRRRGGREGECRGNGWVRQTHLSSLLSYLAVGRWWYPFPPSNVFAFTADAKCQHAASWQSFLIRGKWPRWTSRQHAPDAFCSFLRFCFCLVLFCFF